MVSNANHILQQLLSWGRHAATPAAPPAPAPQPPPSPISSGPDRLTLSSAARKRQSTDQAATTGGTRNPEPAPPVTPPRKGTLVNLTA